MSTHAGILNTGQYKVKDQNISHAKKKPGYVPHELAWIKSITELSNKIKFIHSYKNV
jgi:hypothetical protein